MKFKGRIAVLVQGLKITVPHGSPLALKEQVQRWLTDFPV
jgi:hypothetical protein